MFDNIGGKIKGLAEIITWIGIIASVVTGAAAIWINGEADEGIIVGLLIMAFGSLLSWLMSFLLYGFGELIYKTSVIASILAKDSDVLGESYMKLEDEHDPEKYMEEYSQTHQKFDAESSPNDVLLTLLMQGKITSVQYDELSRKSPQE